MKSKTEISSSKNLSKIGLQDLINKKCKQDHFSYRRYFPIKKNLSSHLPIAQDKDIYRKQLTENKRIEDFRINIASSSIDPNLQRVRLTYHTKSTVKMTPKVKLPLLKIGSMYKQNFKPTQNQKLVKGKEQDGFFVKLPWHDNLVSNYQKSYHNSDRRMQQLNEKGREVEGQIKILERKFRGQSSYDQFHSELRKSTQIDAKDCIKDKDHCKGVQCSMKIQSQYKRQYKKSGNKENIARSKERKAHKNKQFLPIINLKNMNPTSSPKTTLKLKISPAPSLRQILKSTSTHLNV